MRVDLKINIIILLQALALCLAPSIALAAVGCTLNDPDRDVKRIFPQSTGYKTTFVTIKEKGGEALKKEVEDRLGDKLDNIYETIDVPFAYYDILKGREIIGRIHGVNQKGTYGGMQLITATDMEGRIVAFYYQKISSPEAGKFIDKNFTNQFIGLTLNDFMKGNIGAKDPSKDSGKDFQATKRGLKKNLILLDLLKNSEETIVKK